LIYLFGRPKKPGQGRRTLFRKPASERVEPTLDGNSIASGFDENGEPMPVEQLDLLGSTTSESVEPSIRLPVRPLVGIRPDRPIERIVTLFVTARSAQAMAGSDLVVAAEKAGLVFGDRGIFHRMLAGKHEQGPIFSMANMVKPGSFDMSQLDSVRTPGVTLFMTLPGPLPALDAWEMLLPTAQRLAELLDAQVLDEGRNTLGRQRIAHIRDELRAWDRQQERIQIRPGR
jgi:cell division protein ZipA